MKCPTCGVLYNDLADVRQTEAHTIRRRRCFNNHMFRTVEVVDSMTGRPIARQLTSEKLYHRNTLIVKAIREGQLKTYVAARHGLTIQMIPRILRAMGAEDLIGRAK